MLSLTIALITIINLSNGQLPGSIQTGIGTVAWETIDVSMNNNCEWENSEPIQDNTIFPFGMFAGVDDNTFEDGLACGQCYEIKCISKRDSWGACDCIINATVTVMVADFGHDYWFNGVVQPTFDLPINVANNIITSTNSDSSACASGSANGNGDSSKFNFQYRRVCCKHLQNIKITNYEGMTNHWLGFVVSQVRGYGDITNFYMRENGRTEWYECNRNTNGINKNWVCDPWTQDYNNYYNEALSAGINIGVGQDPPYNLPIDIKLTDSSGATLETNDVITNFTVDQVFDFGKNFDAACKNSNQSKPNTTAMDNTETTPMDTTTPVIDTTKMDTTEIGTTKIDTTKMDTTAIDTTAMDTTEMDTTMAVIDTTKMDTTEMDTIKIDTTKMDTTEMDTTEMDTTEMDTTAMDDIITTMMDNPSTTMMDEDDTTDDPLEFYVDCASGSAKTCYEAFPRSCCVVINGECQIADPPILDPDMNGGVSCLIESKITTTTDYNVTPLLSGGIKLSVIVAFTFIASLLSLFM